MLPALIHPAQNLVEPPLTAAERETPSHIGDDHCPTVRCQLADILWARAEPARHSPSRTDELQARSTALRTGSRLDVPAKRRDRDKAAA